MATFFYAYDTDEERFNCTYEAHSPFKKFKLGKPIYIYGLIFIFYILVVKFNFINVIFTVAMLLIPRYGGYMNTDWNSEVEIGSGLGVLIRLSIPFVIFFFRKKSCMYRSEKYFSLFFQNKKQMHSLKFVLSRIGHLQTFLQVSVWKP